VCSSDLKRAFDDWFIFYRYCCFNYCNGNTFDREKI
jgi:hypothetical protein